MSEGSLYFQFVRFGVLVAVLGVLLVSAAGSA